jgi:hypothetical protein
MLCISPKWGGYPSARGGEGVRPMLGAGLPPTGVRQQLEGLTSKTFWQLGAIPLP